MCGCVFVCACDFFSSTSRPQALPCTYETLQPSIPLQRVKRGEGDANVVSKIEWCWKQEKANLKTPPHFYFRGRIKQPTERHAEMV